MPGRQSRPPWRKNSPDSTPRTGSLQPADRLARARVLVLFAIVAALLTGCSPVPDLLRVERVLEGSAVGRFEPFDRTITDPATVRAINDALVALPRAPSVQYEPFCPIAWGLRYRLTFMRASSTIDVATLEADGCRYAHIGLTDRRTTTESFWALLAGSLGFYTRGQDLFPLPSDMR